jgi:hypothetical protein
METVSTFDGSTAPSAASLVGTTRSMLFSNSGVVIMKMMSNTKAKSSSGVTLISESVVSACLSE